MALRTPSGIDISYNEEGIYPGAQIRAADMDKILDNQQYAVTRRRCLLSAIFPPTEISGTGWQNVEKLAACGPNACGLASTVDVEAAWYVLIDSAVDTFSLRINDAVHGTRSKAVAAGVAAPNPVWIIGDTGTFSAPSDGSFWEFDVDVGLVTGAAIVQVVGLALWCDSF